MKSIQNKKTLIIADVHQCIGGYVEKVLEKETDWEHIVFLGDYFDCFETPENIFYYSIKNTCEWLNEKFMEWDNRATWLIGNHDCSYLATYLPKTHEIRKNSDYVCCGYTKNKASEINKTIFPIFMHQMELCVEVGDFILSHAGFHTSHFKPYMDERENIIQIYHEWENNKKHFQSQPGHWIWNIGSCRGGRQGDIGSPIWLDWHNEFRAIPNLKQIVGHTNSSYMHRIVGGNVCIDVYRTCYSIIGKDGKLEIKYI